jgi:hypothetical protein
MTSREYVDWFLGLFNPDLHHYVRKDTFGNFLTIYQPLTRRVLEEVINGNPQEIISFFTKGSPDYIGIDIDDHETGGWTNDNPTEILAKRYYGVLTELGNNPSMVFRSPRGVHAFWFLTQNLPTKVIEKILKQRLGNYPGVEILPTARHALSLPLAKDHLNIELKSSLFPNSIERYSPENILGELYKSAELRQNYQKSTTPKEYNDSESIGKIEDCEKKFLPLKDGSSNEAYKHLVAVYKYKGLSPKQAFDRFEILVRKSPGYSGRLLINLESRIETSYNRLSNGSIPVCSLETLYNDPAIRKFRLIATDGETMAISSPPK